MEATWRVDLKVEKGTRLNLHFDHAPRDGDGQPPEGRKVSDEKLDWWFIPNTGKCQFGV